ncbi:MAG: substrate-binding domain-containing protein [Phycisphaerales bacterium]|nr:substrate-binding domain-containing protein [Phycisphaerales bacterium]
MNSRTRQLTAILFTSLAAILPGCGKVEEVPAAKPGPAARNNSADSGSSTSAPSASGDKTPATPTATTAKLKIAVVPKGTTHDFWRSVHAGALKAQNELGNVEVTFRGPEREDDRQQQVDLVQNLISAGYSAIVLAPLDDKALVAPVKQAAAVNIPVVIFDSGLQGEAGKDFVSYVATDNYKGGQLAGQKMIELVGGKGRVLMLRYAEGSASTALREQGFIDALKTAPGIELIDPKRYAGATRATAQETSENILTSTSDFAGIYCPNESSTFGMLLAIRGKGLAGKVKFVGFDASQGLLDAMRNNEIDALVVQNPIRMGYLAVMTAANHIKGEKVETNIDTGVALITNATMDSPENKDLLDPDLKKYLGEK